MKTGIETYGPNKIRANTHSRQVRDASLGSTSKHGPTSQIEVEGDEHPTTLTLVTAVTAYGEQAGINLVTALEADPTRKVTHIIEVDESTLGVNSIYRRTL